MISRPPSRRVVGAYAVLMLVAIAGLILLAHVLRLDHPVEGPLEELPADGGIDSLREEVDCELDSGREGEDRVEATTEPPQIEGVTSSELYDCPQSWDGRLIRYTGEAIGAKLDQREGVWIQLNDDAYGQQGAPLPTHRDFRGGNAGVGVLFPPALAQQVDVVGGPTAHGDVVQVVGRFVRIDGPTGEVAIIRAEEAVIVQEGRILDLPGSPARSTAAILAAVGALGVTLYERRRRQQV